MKNALEKLVYELRTMKGAPAIEVDVENDKVVFRVLGFYKHGRMTLSLEKCEYTKEDVVVATDRYKGKNVVSSVKDLARINFIEWLNYRDRSGDNWKNPEHPWRDIMLAEGWIREKTIVEYIEV